MTPTLFAKFAAMFERYKRKFVCSFLAIYIGLFAATKVIPEWEPSLGATMAILLVMYFAIIVPYYAFRKVSAETLLTSGNSFWLRALLCNLWLMLAVWFVMV